MPSCHAAVIPAPGVAPETREIAIPDLVPGAILLRTIASEVCGTDVHLYHGRLDGVPYPLIPGHISIGHVEEMISEVQDAEGNLIRPGDTVVFYDVIGACGGLLCLLGRRDTDTLPTPQGVWHHIAGRQAVWWLGDPHLSRAGNEDTQADRGALGRGLHGWGMRPPHRLPSR